MIDEQEIKPVRVIPERVPMGDRTAIIAAGIAIGITLIASPGIYTLMNIPIGLVLMVTLHAADSHEDSNWFQSASFALAWALTFLLIAGLFLVNPYITNDSGKFITDTGRVIKDQFTSIELPALGLIKHSFKEEAAASDFVSFIIVSVVAIFVFVRRRRLYAVRLTPPPPKDENTGAAPTKPAVQPALPPVQPEKSQEPIPQARSASPSLARQRIVDRIILSVSTVVVALLVYIIGTRGSKHPQRKK